MATGRIPPAGSLLETMRAIARDKAKATMRKGSSPGTDDVRGAGNVKTIADLRSKLQHALADVDTSDEQSMHDAREPALREILLWEFGSDFRQDAQFLPIVDAVKSVLDTDPQFQKRFTELVQGLKAKT